MIMHAAVQRRVRGVAGVERDDGRDIHHAEKKRLVVVVRAERMQELVTEGTDFAAVTGARRLFRPDLGYGPAYIADGSARELVAAAAAPDLIVRGPRNAHRYFSERRRLV